MKLFRVEIRKVIYMVAEDALQAEQEGVRFAEEDSGNPDVFVTLATRKWIKRDGWDGALVYGKHTEDYPAEKAVELNDS